MIDRTPTIELSQPILNRIDRNDNQDGFRCAMSQENIDEGDHLTEEKRGYERVREVRRSYLNRFPTAHRMCENTAETS